MFSLLRTSEYQSSTLRRPTKSSGCCSCEQVEHPSQPLKFHFLQFVLIKNQKVYFAFCAQTESLDTGVGVNKLGGPRKDESRRQINDNTIDGQIQQVKEM